MSQQPQERASDQPVAPQKARILPFERPQSELQRAVQLRAQERIDAESVKPKTSPVRSIVTLLAALVPVVLIFSGFFVAVHAVRLITSLYMSAPQSPAPATAEQAEAEQAEVSLPEASQPGVVILVPDRTIKPLAPSTQAPATDERSTPGDNKTQ
jgi:hypothetical protein